MSVFDRFRDNVEQFKEGGRKLKQATELKMEITKLQNREEDLYLQLGQKVHRLHAKGHLRHIEVTEIVEKIEACKEERAQKQRQLDDIMDVEQMRARSEEAGAARMEELARRDDASDPDGPR